MTKELFTWTEYTMPTVILPGTLSETYARSWRERLFSMPWRPWVRDGERPTQLAILIEAHRRALEKMRREVDTNLFTDAE